MTDMSEERNDYGFPRSKCACHACANNCRVVPGYLLAEDIPRLMRHLGYSDLDAFSRENLLASPGALAMKDGEMMRIRTLVPQRRADGACKFLTEDNLCSVHPAAPFACAYFDEHEPEEHSNYKRNFGLVQLTRTWREGGRYARTWTKLDTAGLRSPTPEEQRGIPPEEVERRIAEAMAAYHARG